uniref:Uncharacterized protein n=1 Tax=Globodera rostochiensis TaxID=31243 RepID=A0A914GXS8_GLORO
MHLFSIPITYCLYNFIPVYYAGSYVVVPPLFYAAIVTKFAWIKAHNRSWNTEGAAASSSDKDSARITWTCFAIQSVALCHHRQRQRPQNLSNTEHLQCQCQQVSANANNVSANANNVSANANNVSANANSVNVVGSNRRWALQRSGQPTQPMNK